VAASGDNLWQQFCKAVGANDLLTDPDFATPASRAKNRKALNERVAVVMRKHPNDYWVELMNKVGVPCGPINTIDKVFADPQVKHLGIVRPVDHPKYGAQKIVGNPMHMSRYEQPEKLRHTPESGEHNAEILGSLGYDAKAIEALRTKGAI
jgi:crotonobetainyl-CoA:carnitine CoA-transferase CaiB-like acyl-CoA transferase